LGFYKDDVEISSIKFAKGSSVSLTFKVRFEDVYFGGLDFRSPKFSTPRVNPGGVTTVEFTADADFAIMSYWPSSNRLKATLLVDAE
jgi:hypothetical protein